MKRKGTRIVKTSLIALTLAFGAIPAAAADISTHVLDLARGVGGEGVPVTLLRKAEKGAWVEAGKGVTDANGRIRSFGESAQFPAGIYKLQFDMAAYRHAGAEPFFPEIDIVFRVSDAAAHYHVPAVISPYGYSTSRGN